MKPLFNTLLILLLAPTILMATNPKFKGKYTKTKTLNKEYTVNAEAGLRVDNSYGNIDIVTWNQNKVMIEVTITTNGNDEEKVQEKLDKIDVDFSGSASLVTAKTLFGDKKNSSWSWWGNKNNNVKMEINYSIKLPVTNSVDLNNDYGAINLNKLQGNAKINCDYGQLNIGELMAENNYLNFDYTKNSTIAYMKSGKINADYSAFVLEKTDYLELNADYTRSEVEEVQELNYNNDYGKLYVGTAGSIIGRGDYIPLRVKSLSGELNINSDYGSIEVEKITAAAKNITIRSDYAGIRLFFDPAYSFDFVVDLSYASFDGDSALEITHSTKDYTNKNYKGYHGSKNSGNMININSEYGGVTLEKF